MLDSKLLEIICCPNCRGDLRYDSSVSTLTCVSCGKVYPVKDDIPMLLPDDLSPA